MRAGSSNLHAFRSISMFVPAAQTPYSSLRKFDPEQLKIQPLLQTDTSQRYHVHLIKADEKSKHFLAAQIIKRLPGTAWSSAVDIVIRAIDKDKSLIRCYNSLVSTTS